MARRGTKMTFEKRKRELEKKRKRQDKLERKHGDTDAEGEGEDLVDETSEVEAEVDPIEAMFREALEDEENRGRKKR